ncbi:MAG: hypothetical protein PQJ59_01835 [Spirochaetales bacterium]|nr:hypothetical protein [Spirochaetales bacterium]
MSNKTPASLNNQSKISLLIDAEELTGYQGLTVVRSIDAAADSFSFSLPWDPTDANKYRFKPYYIRVVKVKLDSETIITGYIEKLGFSTAPGNRSANIQGRSASGVIMDWHPGPPFELSGLKFNAISKTLTQSIYDGYNVGIAYASPDFGPIPEVTIDPGQTMYDILTPLASAHNYWSRPTSEGRLEYLQFSSNAASVATLIEGTSPVKEITTSHDVTKRFQEYRAIGASEGEPEVAATVSDYETLGIGVRGRQITALSQQTTDITSAAKFARAKAAINSYTCQISVDGWHYNGNLWTPGEIVTVQAPGAYIWNPTRLIIKQVTMTIDESGGQVCALDLGIPEAFDGTEPKDLPWD